jgi:DNA-binding GntR family transcriptional regulator
MREKGHHNRFRIDPNLLVLMGDRHSRKSSRLIRNKILSGRLEASGRLPSEDELTRHFRVSRITIRSALSHLQNEGLIVRNYGRGTFVAEDIPVKKRFVFTVECTT